MNKEIKDDKLTNLSNTVGKIDELVEHLSCTPIDDYYTTVTGLRLLIAEAQFLLKSAHESNHSKAPIDVNTGLGEVPTSVETPELKESAGALCETGSVRQNEQAKEVRNPYVEHNYHVKAMFNDDCIDGA